MELQQVIMNMKQGGSADGILQVRSDRIQLDIEELLKALSERCKKHGIEMKSAALIELPEGWQPGIQGAAVWDEEWYKFEDEGLLFYKEITTDTQNAKASPRSAFFWNGTYSHDDRPSSDSSSNADRKRNNLVEMNDLLIMNLGTPIVKMVQPEALVVAQHNEPHQKVHPEIFQVYLQRAPRKIQISKEALMTRVGALLMGLMM